MKSTWSMLSLTDAYTKPLAVTEAKKADLYYLLKKETIPAEY